MAVPYGPGDHGPAIRFWQAWFNRMYEFYAPAEDGYYGDDEATAVKEMQRRLQLPQTGIFDKATADRAGYVQPPAGWRPMFFTVEGHMSNMWSGPVADTATQLENEGLCWHQPIGYNNGAIPFDNASAVSELARLLNMQVLDDGQGVRRDFSTGTPWALGTFSQGSIVGYDFYENFLAPGKPLAWREKDRVGTLAYGNPCRATNSIAPWAQGWVTKPNTHGLDPYKRFGLSIPLPANFMDVYREDDIFAENGDDKMSEVCAAVYEAVVRADFFSNPASLAAQMADLFTVPFDEVMGIIMAIIHGVVFLADNPNPHYSPYDIDGGVAWMRDRLAS